MNRHGSRGSLGISLTNRLITCEKSTEPSEWREDHYNNQGWRNRHLYCKESSQHLTSCSTQNELKMNQHESYIYKIYEKETKGQPHYSESAHDLLAIRLKVSATKGNHRQTRLDEMQTFLWIKGHRQESEKTIHLAQSLCAILHVQTRDSQPRFYGDFLTQ